MIPAPLQNILDRLAVAWHERAIALKAASFALVGVVNTAVDFSVFWIGYYYLGLPLVLANMLAWLVAVTVSYVMNSSITFAAGIWPHACGGATMRLCRCRGSPGWSRTRRRCWCLVLLSSRCWLAKLASILVSFVVNFSLSHFVVFRERPPQQDAGH